MSRLSKQERDEIVRAYRAGETSTEIGKRYAIHPAYVRKIASRYGVVKMRVVRFEPPPEPIRFKRPAITLPKQVGSGRQSTAGYLKLM